MYADAVAVLLDLQAEHPDRPSAQRDVLERFIRDLDLAPLDAERLLAMLIEDGLIMETALWVRRTDGAETCEPAVRLVPVLRR